MYPASVMKMYAEWPKLSSFILSNVPQKVKGEIEDSHTTGKVSVKDLHIFMYFSVANCYKNLFQMARKCAPFGLSHIYFLFRQLQRREKSHGDPLVLSVLMA